MADESGGAGVPLLSLDESTTSTPSTPSGTMLITDPLPTSPLTLPEDEEAHFVNENDLPEPGLGGILRDDRIQDDPSKQEGPAVVVSRQPTGLAFSGGGIRSAAFCSGALRKILESNRTLEKVSLSCVSGGGYTGSAFLEWKWSESLKWNRNGEEDLIPRTDKDWQEEFFEKMKNNAGYMCNFYSQSCKCCGRCSGCCVGCGHAILLAVIVICVNILLGCALWFPYALPMAYAVDFVFGDILRENLKCPSRPPTTASPTGPAEYAGLAVYAECSPPVSRILLFSLTLVTSLVTYLISRQNNRVCVRYRGAIRLVSTGAGMVLAMTLFPWFVYNFVDPAPPLLQWMIILACIIMPYFFPITRNYAGVFLLLLVYAEIVAWRVYKTEVFEVIKYSDQVFYWVLFGSAVSIWLAPWVGALQQSVVNLHNRRQLTKAFYTTPARLYFEDVFPWLARRVQPLRKEYTRSKYGDYPMEDIKNRSDKQVYMGDIRDVPPTFISNITVNQWRVGKDPEDPSYQLLAFSPDGVQVVGANVGDDVFEGHLEPTHVRLASAMSMSAAALGTHMGSYEQSLDSVLNLFTLLGLGMGDEVVCDDCRVDETNSKAKACLKMCFLPTIVEIFCGLPLFTFSIPFFLGHGESWIFIAVFIFFCVLAAMSIIAVLPPSNRIVRWFIIHIFYVRFLRGFLTIITNGPRPPPILRLSDGGHFENLALLPLLKKRLKKIVMINGSRISGDDHYGKELLGALQLARDRLNCSFVDPAGRDVIEAIRVGLVKKGETEKPRSFRFKVIYYDDDDRRLDDGEILFIVPRHPSKRKTVTSQPSDTDGWWTKEVSAEEADRLTCCCCHCCHSNNSCVQRCSGLICGQFPHHSTPNQFFTPEMFAAYHREGYGASVEAKVAEFLSVDS